MKLHSHGSRIVHGVHESLIGIWNRITCRFDYQWVVDSIAAGIPTVQAATIIGLCGAWHPPIDITVIPPVPPPSQWVYTPPPELPFIPSLPPDYWSPGAPEADLTPVFVPSGFGTELPESFPPVSGTPIVFERQNDKHVDRHDHDHDHDHEYDHEHVRHVMPPPIVPIAPVPEPGDFMIVLMAVVTVIGLHLGLKPGK